MQESKINTKYPPQLTREWASILDKEWDQPYMMQLKDFLTSERKSSVPIYPEPKDVFAAFNYTSHQDTKVLIMGQDPYSGPGQAHGLSFSVKSGIAVPPSLRNIFIELSNDVGIYNTSGCLLPWAQQGVLLLNSVCTVRKDNPRSHAGKGWELFTDAVVASLSSRQDPVIFVLWGSDAKKKCHFFVDNTHHFVLTAAHPSPLSAFRGFFGCSHFSKINFLLKKQNKKEIDWKLV